METVGYIKQLVNVTVASFVHEPFHNVEELAMTVVPPTPGLSGRFHHLGCGAPALLRRLNEVVFGEGEKRLAKKVLAGRAIA